MKDSPSRDTDTPMYPGKPTTEAPIYFLGGRDLEMLEIARVLREHSASVVDHQL